MMQMDFSGQVLLVTGAARGIGAAVARLAVAAGATVVITDRDAEAAQRLSDGLPGTRALGLDVTSEAACHDVFSQVLDSFGRLDCLVNSAGIMEPLRRTADQPLAVWEQVIDVNLKGSFLTGREAARVMQSQPQGRSPSIIFVSSITGLGGFQAFKCLRRLEGGGGHADADHGP